MTLKWSPRRLFRQSRCHRVFLKFTLEGELFCVVLSELEVQLKLFDIKNIVAFYVLFCYFSFFKCHQNAGNGPWTHISTGSDPHISALVLKYFWGLKVGRYEPRLQKGTTLWFQGTEVRCKGWCCPGLRLHEGVGVGRVFLRESLRTLPLYNDIN